MLFGSTKGFALEKISIAIDSPSTEATFCIECEIKGESNATTIDAIKLRQIRNSISGGSPEYNVTQVSRAMNWANGCEKFVDSGSYGPWGKTIVDQLNTEKYQSLMDGSSDLKIICPGYDAMNTPEKQGLWVAIIASMAHFESSCRTNPEKHKGPNGFLVGLMQLHQGKEKHYSRSCDNNDGKRPESSISCSLAMLRNEIDKDDELFSDDSYWDVLRPNGRGQVAEQIQEAVRQYLPCR